MGAPSKKRTILEATLFVTTSIFILLQFFFFFCFDKGTRSSPSPILSHWINQTVHILKEKKTNINTILQFNWSFFLRFPLDIWKLWLSCLHYLCPLITISITVSSDRIWDWFYRVCVLSFNTTLFGSVIQSITTCVCLVWEGYFRSLTIVVPAYLISVVHSHTCIYIAVVVVGGGWMEEFSFVFPNPYSLVAIYYSPWMNSLIAGVVSVEDGDIEVEFQIWKQINYFRFRDFEQPKQMEFWVIVF